MNFIDEEEDEYARQERAIEAADNRRKERRERRHPLDFDVWPSNEQNEAFKRGGR